ncbi:general transcription factor 3C polypeptide 5-like isoform X1 [Canna indica]|uniref:General transcription factor 3C polypeptide 5-like isoform X1 n=1 Tax=Canna indica TaxID=4628 RepID=A0AAQ3QHM2_9LILI|nr:general transcription factor 3C polypeptide 5-like isoform X1 [Canna indica]
MDDSAGEPSTSSLIINGAVSGVLPDSRTFAVHYPGYPTSTARAIETLGGLPGIAKVRSSENANLELRFRPEDPHSHPAFGELRSSTSLLLRICKNKGLEHSSRGEAGESGQELEPLREENLSAEVVARVNHAYHFEGMADYQYVLGVHAAKERRKKRPWTSEEELEPGNEKDGIVDMDGADLMMLVPPLFSIKDRPEKIVLNPPANLFSKSIQKGVMEHKWEVSSIGTLVAQLYIRIPRKFNWEDRISNDTSEWEWQVAVSKLFDEKPIWPRWSLHERLWDDGHKVSANHLKRLLFRAGYYFSTGPFARFWIRKGYDPRSDPESRVFQKVDFRVPPELRNHEDTNSNTGLKQTQKELCHFQVWPSKSFIYLQLSELDDNCIQQEIRKPARQKACTHAAGWFSGALLKILRLHVSLRFLLVYPNGNVEHLINHTRDLLERCKRDEPLRRLRISKSEENQLVNRDSSGSVEVTSNKPNECGHIDQDEIDNCEIEEEEEELDGYESLPLACEDGFSPDGGISYKIGERIPNDYLEEILRGFPLNKESEDQQLDEALGADISDEEYQIFEQDSDDGGSFF